MDCQQRKCCPIARHGPWPNRSRWEVAFYSGERQSVERVTQRLFGKRLTRREYATLAGAPRGACWKWARGEVSFTWSCAGP